MPPTPSSKQSHGPSPEQLAQQAMMASHAVAQKAAAAHSDALTKIHGDIQSQSAPSDREQHLLGLLASMSPPGADGSVAGSSPGGGDPQQQAVWDEFPSTDPTQAQQMMQSADDPEHGLAALVQQSQADLQKFQAMQSDILNQIMQMLGAPAGEPAGGPPVASPGVGGENAVGYS